VSDWEKDKIESIVGAAPSASEGLGSRSPALIDGQFGICDDVERAILQSTKLTRREQDALLAAYDVFVDRNSAGKVAFFRARLIPPADHNDAADQLIEGLSVAEQA
jgi:hypothetical protein